MATAPIPGYVSPPETSVTSQPNGGAVAPNENDTNPNATTPQPSGALAPVPVTSTPPVTLPTTINSSTVTPTSATPFVTPTPSPIPSVSSLNTVTTPPLIATPEDTQMSALDTQTEALNTEDAGKAADTTAAQNAAGLPALTAQQQDLTAQLTSLKDEAAAIPQQLQLDATGRGITADGLAPVQTAALRNNSIQALSISAMIDATNGLIASANTKITAAINAKYGPIEAQIAANTANLKLILNDPQTTIDEKNQAQAQLDAQNTQKNQLDTAKQNATDVLDAAKTAAANGAPASVLQQMQAAPDGATALGIASAAGYATNPLTVESTEMDIATKEQALQVAASESSPEAISGAVNSLTQFNGVPFYTTTDLTGMDTKTKQAFQTAAMTSGAKPLSPKDGDAVTAINSSLANLASISSFIQGGQTGQAILPTGWFNQPQQYANVKLNDFLQTNNQLASYQSWMASIPDLLGALKGSSSGSGGSSRLFGTITTLLPAMTDTLPAAMKKLQNMNQILTTIGNGIMGIPNDGGQTYNGITLPGVSAPAGGTGSSAGSSYNGIQLLN